VDRAPAKHGWNYINYVEAKISLAWAFEIRKYDFGEIVVLPAFAVEALSEIIDFRP